VGDDVLRRLDEEIQRAERQRQQWCACGCGVALKPDGPSLYYATQDCQHAAMQATAINPQQVQAAGDYSYYSSVWARPHGRTGPDHPEPQPQVSPVVAAESVFGRPQSRDDWPPEGWTEIGFTAGDGLVAVAPVGTPAPPVAADMPPPAMYDDPCLFAYRRVCVYCGTCAEPIDEYEPDDVASDANPTVVSFVHGSDLVHRQRCSACDRPFRHPVRSTCEWNAATRCWILVARCSTGHARCAITVDDLAGRTRTDAYIRDVWERLTQALLNPPRPPMEPSDDDSTFPAPTGRTAWSNPETDPLQDIRNWLAVARADMPTMFGMSDNPPMVPHYGSGEPSDPAATNSAPSDHNVEPSDPRQRALWLRQHRNTGPAARRRPPRSIDPRHAR
jgi:hypothetical protein